MTWFGPTPRVIVNDPQLVREILGNKFGHFQRRRNNGMVKRLVNGLVSHEGQKWAPHRRIISPAFHVEKLKVISMLTQLEHQFQMFLHRSIQTDVHTIFRWIHILQKMLPAFAACSNGLITRWAGYMDSDGTKEIDV
jgi:hypothetical protein